MKLSFPKVGKYVVADDFEITIPSGYSGNLLAFKLYYLGWKIGRPIQDLFLGNNFDSDCSCKITIPRGIILLVDCYEASKSRNYIKVNVPVKDNPQLKSKIDWKAEIASVCPGFNIGNSYLNLNLDWYESALKRTKITFYCGTEAFDGLELEEYVEPGK